MVKLAQRKKGRVESLVSRKSMASSAIQVVMLSFSSTVESTGSISHSPMPWTFGRARGCFLSYSRM